MRIEEQIYLPYETPEGEKLMSLLKDSLAKAIQSGSIVEKEGQFLGSRLAEYLDLSHELSLDDHINLVKFTYNMVLWELLTPYKRAFWAKLCIRLVKQHDKLISSSLSLEWRQLFDFVFTKFLPASRNYPFKKESERYSSLFRLAKKSKLFFPSSDNPSTGEQILILLRPYFYPHDLSLLCPALSLLESFYPANQPSALIHLPEMISLVNLCPNNRSYLGLCFRLYHRIIKYHGVKAKSFFDASTLSKLFSYALCHLFHLPDHLEGQLSMHSPSWPQDYEQFSQSSRQSVRSFGKFVAILLSLEISESESIVSSFLREMINAIQSFLHPSNTGKWTSYLCEFLVTLCKMLSFLNIKPKSSQSISISSIVELLVPVIEWSIHSREPDATHSSLEALKYLSYLCPNQIIPSFLNRAIESFTNTMIMEPHRIRTALGVFGSLSRQLVRSDVHLQTCGFDSLMTILTFVANNISLSDPLTTYASLSCLFKYFNWIYLDTCQDSISCISEYEESFDRLSDDDSMGKFRTVSACFEEWIILFLDRVLSILENLPKPIESASITDIDSSIAALLWITCEIVFAQLSPQLSKIVIDHVCRFATNNVLSNSLAYFGYLVDNCKGTHTSYAIEKFVPTFITAIETEISLGSGTDPLEHSETTMNDALNWHLNNLSSSIKRTGMHLIFCKDSLLGFCKIIFKIQSVKSHKLAMRVIKHSIFALTGYYPLDSRSIILNEQEPNYLQWGRYYSANDLNLEWHIPTKEKCEFAVLLVKSCIPHYLGIIEDFISNFDTSSQKRSNIKRSLYAFYNIFKSVSHWPYPNEKTEEKEDKSISAFRECYPLSCGLYQSMFPKGSLEWISNTKKQIQDIIHSLCSSYLGYLERDPVIVQHLILLMSVLSRYSGVDNESYPETRKALQLLKKSMKIPSEGKKYPRPLLVRIAYFKHLQRLRHNGHFRCCSKEILHISDDLFLLATSCYSSNRVIAQKELQQLLVSFPSLRKRILGKVFDLIKDLGNSISDDESYEKMKGAFYILQIKQNMRLCHTDANFTLEFIKMICTCILPERPNVNALFKLVFYTFLTGLSFPHKSLIESVPLIPTNLMILQDWTSASELQMTKHHQELNNIWKSILDYMLSILKGNIHWLRRLMILALFDKFQERDRYIPINDVIDQFYQASISDEMPLRLLGCKAIDYLSYMVKPRVTKSMNIDNALYIDKGYAGWRLLHDSKYSCYSDDKASTIFKNEILAIQNILFNDKYLFNFFSFLSQERNQEGFDTSFPQIIKGWTRLMSTDASNTRKWMDQMNRFVQGCLNAEQSEQRSKIRACSEVIAGVIRGIRHYSIQDMEWIWIDYLIPWIESALFKNGISSSMLTATVCDYWKDCMNYVYRNQDPKRLKYLTNWIFDQASTIQNVTIHDNGISKRNDESFIFLETFKLDLMVCVCSQFGWKMAMNELIISRVMEILIIAIQYPYEQVRMIAADCLQELIVAFWDPFNTRSFDKPQKLIDEFLDSLRDTVKNGSLRIQKNILDSLMIMFCNAIAEYDLGVIPIVIEFFQWTSQTYTSMVIQNKVIQEQTEAHGDEQDSSNHDISWMELSSRMEEFIEILSRVYIEQDNDFMIFVQQLKHVLLNNDINNKMIWQVRLRFISMLKMFYFIHLFSWFRLNVDDLLSWMIILLQDQKVEIREGAYKLVTSILRTRQGLVLQWIGMVKESLVDVKGKHSLALAYSASIEAFPYHIPPWMPQILVSLSFLSKEKQPTQGTVKKTLSEFRRTHQDNWKEDIEKFTQDELDIIVETVSAPSYFA